MIIAITGKMCSGKSTVANYLKERYNFKICSFGEPVKRYAALIFGDNTKNRPIIQDFAQKIKELDEDVWVNYLLRNIDQNDNQDDNQNDIQNDNQNDIQDDNQNDNIVIDDLRFPNEYDALHKRGVAIIKIDIDRAFQIHRLKETYPNNYDCHISRIDNISETHIDNIKENFLFKSTSESEGLIYTFIDNIINKLRNN